MENLPTEYLPTEYLLLFNAISETEITLENLRQRLIKVQIEAEELYISRDD